MTITSLERFKAAVKIYLTEVERKLLTGNAREHAYRDDLQNLLKALVPDLLVINEPARTEIGQPDLIVSEGLFPKGYIETKDIGVDLEQFEKTDQFNRYLGLQNLITTDYLEFRWYVLEEIRPPVVQIGFVNAKNRIEANEKGIEQLYQMLDMFCKRPVPPVRSPKELASRMAALAKNMERVIDLVLKIEGETGSLHQKLIGFREILIPDLTIDQFADMYAQTIVYGYFAARCNHKGKEDFSKYRAASEIPKTNPFLRRMFATFSEEDDKLTEEGIDWLINDLVDLLRVAKIEEILLNFGQKTRQQDPVVHFYETFLTAYNPKLREQRGVYYTPEPVVGYIVRSVDYLLRTKFDVADGLGGTDKIKISIDDKIEEIHRVLILDPATGTGTFLHEVIEEIYRNSFAENEGLWSSYVTDHLLPRLFGFELMMAPYAVTHMKLGLQLQKLGYDFNTNERLQVYLTNSLEESGKGAATFAFAQWLADEANAARDVKLNKPVMVVLGNPPYSGHSANASYRLAPDPKTQKMKRTPTWIGGLLQDYYKVDGRALGEKNPKWLQDDYVKFFRFAQEKVRTTGYGIVAMITNNGFLDNPTFRGMRQNLLQSFDEIFILDLHGNSKKKEKTPKGGKDENVFDIQQGVSISLCVKKDERDTMCQVSHADLFGLRDDKYEYLSARDISKTKWKKHVPKGPLYLFAPQDNRLEEEYSSYFPLRDAMPVNVLGFQSHRDPFALDINRKVLLSRFKEFYETETSDTLFVKKYAIEESKSWNVADARGKMRKEYISEEDEPRQIEQSKKIWQKDILEVWYRPFDKRYSFYSNIAIDRPRRELLDHVANKENLCLNVTRQTKETEWRNAIVSDMPSPAVFVEVKDGSNVFPLFLYKRDAEQNLFSDEEHQRSFNFSKEFISLVESKLGIIFGKKGFTAESVFQYIYAILYSPAYRVRYVSFLKNDFPRIPITSNLKLFKSLSSIGGDLIAYHTMKKKGKLNVSFKQKGTGEVSIVAYEPQDQRVFINERQYFEGVPEEIWNFKMGGYQVAEKWLKDRKNRTLKYDESRHYMDTLAALGETIRLMGEIDVEIEKNGSWPLK